MYAYIQISLIATLCQLTLCQETLVCQNNRLEVFNDNRTIIRLTKENSVNVKYKWKVTFQSVNNTCKQQQRCNLKAWDATRNLEKYLTRYRINSDSPEIAIDDSMIMPGVQFTVKVTVYSNGIVVSEKQFILPQDKGAVRPTSSNKVLGLLQLVGSNTTYADAEYYLDANVSLCDGSINAVRMQWDLLDDTGNKIRNFDQRGLELRISPKFLSADKSYSVRGSAVIDKSTIDTKKHYVTVRKRGLILKLNVKTLTVGVNEPIRLIAFVHNPDNTGSDFDLDWSCKFEGRECEDFNGNSAIMEMETGFSESGRYEINVKVEKGDDLKNDACVLNVVDDIKRTIEVDEIKDEYSPFESIEITARVTNLATGCLVGWTSLNEPGYETLNLEEIPGYQGLLNVSVKEDSLLEEFTDYENETIEKDFSFLIPPAAGAWEGIRGDSSYLLRLNVDCFERDGTQKKMFTDIAIQTNGGPELKPLIVTPKTGFALITQFKFKTTQADDKLTDYPILYKYGYIVGNITSYFKVSSDQYTTETILPYYVSGVQTILKACDSRGSCSMAKGPIINTQVPEDISEQDDSEFKALFTSLLSTGDYNKAFVYAMALLQTYKNLNNDLLEDDMQDFVTEKINNQFKIILGNTATDDEAREVSNELIKETKMLADIVKLPESLLNNIVRLRAKYSGEMRQRIVTDQEAINRLLDLISNLDSQDISSYSVQNVKDYLESAEFIITKSGNVETIEEQKQSIIIHLDKYLGKLCSLLYKGQPVKIVLKSLTLSLEKLRSNYFSSFVAVPYTPNDWNKDMKVKFGNWRNAVKELRLCVAKGLFKDYFNDTQLNYFVDVYNANTHMRFKSEPQLLNEVIMEREPGDEITCTVFNYNAWGICQKMKESPTHILCQCNGFGYYGIAKVEVTARNTSQNIPSTTSSTITPTTNIFTNGVAKAFTTIGPIPSTIHADPRNDTSLEEGIIFPPLDEISSVPINTNTLDIGNVASSTININETHRNLSIVVQKNYTTNPPQVEANVGESNSGNLNSNVPLMNTNDSTNVIPALPSTINNNSSITEVATRNNLSNGNSGTPPRISISNSGSTNRSNGVSLNDLSNSNSGSQLSTSNSSRDTFTIGDLKKSNSHSAPNVTYMSGTSTNRNTSNSGSPSIAVTNGSSIDDLSIHNSRPPLVSVTNESSISDLSNHNSGGSLSNSSNTSINSSLSNANSGTQLNVSNNVNYSNNTNPGSLNGTNTENSGKTSGNGNSNATTNNDASNKPNFGSTSGDSNTNSSVTVMNSTSSSINESISHNENPENVNKNSDSTNSSNPSIENSSTNSSGNNFSTNNTTNISTVPSTKDIEITSNQTAGIQKASILSSNNLTKGDQISLIIIGISILGMVLIGIIGAILNRVKRERTIETTDSLDFPKYANIFHPDTLDTISQ